MMQRSWGESNMTFQRRIIGPQKESETEKEGKQ